MNSHRHHNSVKPTLPPLEPLIGSANGLFVKRATIDAKVGDEMILLLRDSAPTIAKLGRLDPLMLNLRGGVERNLLGQVAYIHFWATHPDRPDDVRFSSTHCFDPNCQKEIEFWREVAEQEHWHLFLLVGNEMKQYITFVKLGFDKQIEGILASRDSSINFSAEAEQLFRGQRTGEEIRTAADGSHQNLLMLRKGDLENLSEEQLVNIILSQNQRNKRTE